MRNEKPQIQKITIVSGQGIKKYEVGTDDVMIISDESIEIFIPPGPWFKLSWADIKGVSVTRITKHLMYFRSYVLVSLPEISFSIKDQLDRTIQLRKFHSSKKKEILMLLKNYSDKLNKSFYGSPIMEGI